MIVRKLLFLAILSLPIMMASRSYGDEAETYCFSENISSKKYKSYYSHRIGDLIACGRDEYREENFREKKTERIKYPYARSDLSCQFPESIEKGTEWKSVHEINLAGEWYSIPVREIVVRMNAALGVDAGTFEHCATVKIEGMKDVEYRGKKIQIEVSGTRTYAKAVGLIEEDFITKIHKSVPIQDLEDSFEYGTVLVAIEY